MNTSRSDEDRDAKEIDDQFRAILEGLRTTIPGVMVLFSFLLILPLQSSFPEISASNTVLERLSEKTFRHPCWLKSS